MTKSLLPTNATELERSLESAINREELQGFDFSKIWDPWECDKALLPWLAWAVGVKEWSLSWPESRQRQVIASSMGIRKTAGTVAAMRKAIESLDIQGIDYSEWHEYGGQPGTYRITATLEDRGMTQQQYDELVRVIRSAGRLSAWMDPAGFTVVGRAKLGHAISAGSGAAITTLPLRRSERTESATLSVCSLIRAAVAVGVYPTLTFELSDTTNQARLTTTQGVSWATIYPLGE